MKFAAAFPGRRRSFTGKRAAPKNAATPAGALLARPLYRATSETEMPYRRRAPLAAVAIQARPFAATVASPSSSGSPAIRFISRTLSRNSSSDISTSCAAIEGRTESPVAVNFG